MNRRSADWARGIGQAFALGVLMAMLGCGAKPGQPVGVNLTIDADHLRRGIGGEPATLDPGKAVDVFSFEVIRDLYEGLTTEAPDGTILPGVAAKWTVDSSGTRFSFEIRHDAKWSNGKALRAQDFVTAWRRVVDPKRGSPVADTLRLVAGASAIIAGKRPPASLGVFAVRDDLLVVDLEQPAPYFPQLLTHSATFPIYSEEAAAAHTSTTWVSNGPYVLSSWTPGANIKLIRNSSYWDYGAVRIANIEYLPIADENSELNQYRAGELDVTQSVPSSALPSIRRDRPNELFVAPFLGTAYYAFNLRSPTFSSAVSLRKALAMSIDRRVLKNTIFVFGQEVAYGFVPPGTWNYDPQSWQWKRMSDTTRLAEARRLYSAAGYSDRNPLRLRLLFNSNPTIKRLAIAIASMWKDVLGVETELIDEEYRVFLESRKDTSRWDVARLGWTADYNDAGNFLDIFRQISPNNDARYSNTEFEALLDQAAATPDSSYRRNLLEQAEALMLSEYPVVPIYFYASKRLIKSYVKGGQTNPLNRLYSKHLYIGVN